MQQEHIFLKLVTRILDSRTNNLALHRIISFSNKKTCMFLLFFLALLGSIDLGLKYNALF